MTLNQVIDKLIEIRKNIEARWGCSIGDHIDVTVEGTSIKSLDSMGDEIQITLADDVEIRHDVTHKKG